MSNDGHQVPAATRPPASARRCLPEQSVSLRQISARQAANLHGSLAQQSKPESAASSLVNNRNSSGESSNVDNWFDNSNNNIGSDKHSRLTNNEPPFFLRNNSSSGSPPTNAPLTSQPSKLLHSTGSSSEEYRSVIDDLTIQNKRLKERLRRYEQTSSPHLQSEQLFELRVHGLPADRKRQLEDLLRGFAQSMSAPPKSQKQSQSSSSRNTLARGTKQSSSMASTRFAPDSGYGSMTTPNQASASKASMPTAGSNAASGSNSGKVSLSVSDMNAKHRSMQSYLRDTSSQLLPTSAAGLSDRAKKKLVVLRLEQIFGGRGALPESTGQPEQQQELSNIAARDDRTALGSLAYDNDNEGAREALIMSASGENNSPDPDAQPDAQSLAHSTPQDHPASSKHSYVEQRPTRPLDLDPGRAQVPSDNIEYFRHLGFNMAPSDARDKVIADSDGWIYVNLLFGMAQLHTLNVTTDFAKRAVAEYSDKFELSSDGRKVRWKTHPHLVHNSSISSDDHDVSDEPIKTSAAAVVPGQKNASATMASTPATSHHNHHSHSRTPTRKNIRRLIQQGSLNYTPIFQRNSETDEDASMADYESGDSWAGAAGNASSGQDSHARGQKRRAGGPIIFYNNAYFCTDLSGDGGNVKNVDGTPQVMPQEPVTNKVPQRSATLGLEERKSRRESLESDALPRALMARYFEYDADEPPAKRRAVSAADEEGGDAPIHFPEGRDSTAKHVSFAESHKALEFEACGLGGATPADNLVITVVKETRPRPTSHKGSTLRPCLTRLDGLLDRSSIAAPEQDRILSVRTSALKPSTLPEPSVAYEPGDFGEDEDDEDEDASPDRADAYDANLDQVPNMVLLDRNPIRSQYSSDDSGRSEASSLAAESGSQAELFDMLATARQIDPQMVLAKEREYEAEMAERLAEEIPAGSSAATAGGGSNHGSPLEGVLKPQNMALSGDGKKMAVAADDSSDDDDDEDEGDSTGVERSISS